MEAKASKGIDLEMQKAYLLSMLRQMDYYEAQSPEHLSLVFFVCNALDLLSVEMTDREAIVEWIYGLQVQPSADHLDRCQGGFRGGYSILGPGFHGEGSPAVSLYDQSSLVSTMSALLTLLICGDDLSRVNRSAILEQLKRHQLADGNFLSNLENGEADLRFCYAACVICHLLDGFSSIDCDLLTRLILSCQSPLGPFAFSSLGEPHGGATYCSVASLCLMGRHDLLASSQHAIIQWCMERQITGFQGRPNRLVDSCYSFWIGSTLALLGGRDFIDPRLLRFFLEQCACRDGGFCKQPTPLEEKFPDVLHTSLALCGLSLIRFPKVEDYCPSLCIRPERIPASVGPPKQFDPLIQLQRE